MRQIEAGPEGGAASLRVREAPVPVARAGELLIEVDYAGVNRPDLLQRNGRYPPRPDASAVMGLEVAGHVVALGADVGGWQVGDAVCALTPGGGYAEYCRTPVGQALPVPAGLSLEQAACLPENWFTVWANLVDLGHLAAGERLLVHGGAGGIGPAAIALAQLRGAPGGVTGAAEEHRRLSP